MAFTFFFRDIEPLNHAVGFLMSIASGRSRVRIWDAGCATGQEPFTLAILLAEVMHPFAFRNVRIFATDCDPPLLEILKKGVYPREELQRIPADLFEKYFQPTEKKDQFQLIDQIRQCIQPEVHDLLTGTPIRNGFSLILCKNVLLHFQPPQRVEVIRMFHDALEPGGIFVTEHTQKMPGETSHLFEQLLMNCQVFRRIEATT
jgi:chemotaxis protein methyltransferase CheR